MTTTNERDVDAPTSADEVTAHDLAWKIAEVAADPVAVPAESQAMVINRLIDNAAVSAASVGRHLVAVARAQARAHRNTPGATVFGIEGSYSPEWAAFANGVAVGDLEFQDAFLAGGHPGDTIPVLVAVAQQAGLRGTDLIRGIATAYEVQISLARATSAPPETICHDAHLGVSLAAGMGTMLRLPPETIYGAIGHVAHLAAVLRQCAPSRSGWQRHAPAYIGKSVIEAVDRTMRGEGAPTATAATDDWYRHHDQVVLPGAEEPKRAIMDSYSRQHSAAYLGQTAIDLALRMRDQVRDVGEIESVVLHTGHHTHVLIGTGSGDTEKFDPDAPRHVLSHSAMYLFAVALQDGAWHHERSYARERAHRPDTLELWRKISTVAASERAVPIGSAKAHFGIRADITLRGGTVLFDELAVADAHPGGAHPFGRKEYVAKFAELTDGVIDRREQQRFLDVAMCLGDLKRGALGMLNPLVDPRILDAAPTTYGIFR